MKQLLLAGLAAGGVLALGACSDYYGDDYGYYGSDYGYYPSAYYHGGMAAVDYDGYYDDYYGPFYDDYWGNDGFFYYSVSPGGRFVRDQGHHFRRGMAAGFHAVHGHPRDMGRRY
jgi:hypothetical protein